MKTARLQKYAISLVLSGRHSVSVSAACPPSCWPAKQIQSASKVIFWAAGQKGGEIVEFKAGGVTGKTCQDSFEASTGQIALTKEWKRYEIPLRKSQGTL